MPRNNQNLARYIASPELCGEKRRYPNRREAETVREQQELLHLGLELEIYKCTAPGCRGWHLTRKKQS